MEYAKKLPGPIVLIKEAWALFQSKRKDLLSVSVLVVIAQLIVVFALPAERTVTDKVIFSWPYLILSIVAGIVSMIVSIASIYIINDNTSAKDALSHAPKIVWPYFLTSLLLSLIILVGFLLLIVPGIIFAVWYSLVGIVVIVENIKYMQALTRSKELVKGHTGEVLVRWVVGGLLAILIIGVPSGIISYLSSDFYANIFDTLVLLLILPMLEAFNYLIYKHLKEIKSTVPAASEPSQPQQVVTV
jgi:hypothetical protein